MARGISIHIGVNRVDPAHYQGWSGELGACEYDANDMAALAKGRGLETRHVLLTADATAEKVLGAIEEVAKDLEAGDLLFLTYAGHGSQIRDVSGDEPDQRDETWVLYDRQVSDDELYARYVKFRAGVRVLVFSDSCHSGTVSRKLPDFLNPDVLVDQFGSTNPDVIEARVRAMPFELQKRVYEANKETYDRVGGGGAETAPMNATVVLVSGCQDNQTSADGERNGLFTGMVRAVWDEGRFRTYRGFHRRVVSRMPVNQTPNLMGYGAEVAAFLRQPPLKV